MRKASRTQHVYHQVGHKRERRHFSEIHPNTTITRDPTLEATRGNICINLFFGIYIYGNGSVRKIVFAWGSHKENSGQIESYQKHKALLPFLGPECECLRDYAMAGRLHGQISRSLKVNSSSGENFSNFPLIIKSVSRNCHNLPST